MDIRNLLLGFALGPQGYVRYQEALHHQKLLDDEAKQRAEYQKAQIDNMQKEQAVRQFHEEAFKAGLAQSGQFQPEGAAEPAQPERDIQMGPVAPVVLPGAELQGAPIPSNLQPTTTTATTMGRGYISAPGGGRFIIQSPEEQTARKVQGIKAEQGVEAQTLQTFNVQDPNTGKTYKVPAHSYEQAVQALPAFAKLGLEQAQAEKLKGETNIEANWLALPENKGKGHLDWVRALKNATETSTEAGLSERAATGDKIADAALKRLDASKLASRPVTNVYAPSNPNVNMNTGLVGEELLKTLPAGLAVDVRALINYSKQPPSGRASVSGYGAQILNLAHQADPNYDEKLYPTRSKMFNSYTSGTQSKEINSVNTVLGHAGALGESIDALSNNNVLLLNRIANSMGVQIGKDPVTTFKTIVHRIGPELTRAYVGSGGEMSERYANEGDFDPNLSPQQLKSNLGITIKLLRSKIGSMENQWKNTMGKTDFSERFITPEAQSVVDKYSVKGKIDWSNPFRAGDKK